MAHFYGTLQGSRGQATRCGTKVSGMTTDTASWKGAVRAIARVQGGEDIAQVTLTDWRGEGQTIPLYYGSIGGSFDVYVRGEVDGWSRLLTTDDKEAAHAAMLKDGRVAVIVPAGAYFSGV